MNRAPAKTPPVERMWVTEFFETWRDQGQHFANDRAFYEVLRSVSGATLLPPAEATIAIEPESDEDQRLMALWQGWAEFLSGREEDGLKTFRSVGKAHGDRPEPWIFIGCAALLRQDRKTAYENLTKASLLAPVLKPLSDLVLRFGVRKEPPVPFLERDNAINVALGKRRRKNTAD